MLYRKYVSNRPRPFFPRRPKHVWHARALTRRFSPWPTGLTSVNESNWIHRLLRCMIMNYESINLVTLLIRSQAPMPASFPLNMVYWKVNQPCSVCPVSRLSSLAFSANDLSHHCQNVQMWDNVDRRTCPNETCHNSSLKDTKVIRPIQISDDQRWRIVRDNLSCSNRTTNQVSRLPLIDFLIEEDDDGQLLR